MPFGLGKSQRGRDHAQEFNDEVVGLIEPGVEVEGKLKSSGGLFRLNSHFKGEIRSEGVVVVADRGEVEGEIYAKLISISGKVKGNVHATDLVEIKEHGIVLGDIHTPVLDIKPGGFFSGHCQMPTPGPAKEPASELESKDQI